MVGVQDTIYRLAMTSCILHVSLVRRRVALSGASNSTLRVVCNLPVDRRQSVKDKEVGLYSNEMHVYLFWVYLQWL